MNMYSWRHGISGINVNQYTVKKYKIGFTLSMIDMQLT
jgi:hypothetical protein